MKPTEWGMLILLSIFWGGSFFFVEIALRDFQPFTVVFLRVTLAALILIFTVILAHLLTSDERLTLRKTLGVLIGFLGVYIMMKPELKDGFSWRGLGQIAVLGATVSYGFAGIFGKRFKQTSPIVNSAGMLICSSLMMFPFAVIIDSPWLLNPSLEAVAAVFGIAIVSTAMAYLLYFRILAAAGATNVLLVTFLIPISALLLGVGVLEKVINVFEYIGMGCIFLGLMVIDGRALKWIKSWLNFKQEFANR
jgi:drug/metabolite transporter (DMT)-like permease